MLNDLAIVSYLDLGLIHKLLTYVTVQEELQLDLQHSNQQLRK